MNDDVVPRLEEKVDPVPGFPRYRVVLVSDDTGNHSGLRSRYFYSLGRAIRCYQRAVNRSAHPDRGSWKKVMP